VVSGEGLESGTITSSMIYYLAQFGQAYQKYDISIDYQYETRDTITNKKPKYETNAPYLETAR
jgi:hypothetical protein